jgi:hypothetical protein
VAADEDDIAIDEIGDVDGPALLAAGRGADVGRIGADASGCPRIGYASGYLDARVEPAAARSDALAKAFGRVIGHDHRDSGASLRLLRAVALALGAAARHSVEQRLEPDDR